MGFGSVLNNAMYVSNRDNPEEEKPQVRLDTLSGRCLGVDLLCVLHAALFSTYTSVVFNEDSNIVELKDGSITKYLTKWYETHSFVSLGIKLVCVLDGFKDPAKETNVRKTRSSRFLSKEELRELHAQIVRVRKEFDTLGSLDICQQESAHKKLVIEQREVLQRMRRSVKLNEQVFFEAVRWCRSHDGVDVMFAPGQADAQLIRLEMDRLTDGTISVDTDIFGHGSRCFIRGLCSLRKTERVCILTPQNYTDKTFQSFFGNVPDRARQVALFSSFLKSDYNPKGTCLFSHYSSQRSIKQFDLLL